MNPDTGLTIGNYDPTSCESDNSQDWQPLSCYRRHVRSEAYKGILPPPGQVGLGTEDLPMSGHIHVKDEYSGKRGKRIVVEHGDRELKLHL